MKNIGVQIKRINMKAFPINFIRWIVVLCMFSITLLITNTTSASTNLSKVYYVYLNYEFVGIVDDDKILDQLIEEKIQIEKAKDPNQEYSVGDQILFVPEHVFKSNAENQKVISYMENNLHIQTKAQAIIINNVEAVYVRSGKDAEEVLRNLKLQYVTEEQLKVIEKHEKDPTLAWPILEINETRVVKINFQEKVEIKEVTVDLQKIVDTNTAFQLLLKGTSDLRRYIIQEGDTLESLAEQFKVSIDYILENNPRINEKFPIRAGETLYLSLDNTVVNLLIQKEKFVNENIAFTTQMKDDRNSYRGEYTISQKGQNGLREATYVFYEKNGKLSGKEEVYSKVLKEPVTQIVLKGIMIAPDRGTGFFVWPTKGGFITSGLGMRWGKFHAGIDIAGVKDKTILAADNGTVKFAGCSFSCSSGYGKHVIIDHNNGFITLYGHLSQITVEQGQSVARGQQIGVMGNTGQVVGKTGVHLHFEVRINGIIKNPLQYLE